ncbi:MAG: hypothetical protein M1827_005990 [Pycnora praestabilis]|nr:MAG: hypothetical protein M1827_005990 [Pycnora praestabilis]
MTAQRTPLKLTVYVGTFVHCKSLQELDICENGAIGVDEEGKIAFVERDLAPQWHEEIVSKYHMHWKDAEIIRPPPGGFFFPGFIDTHIHASQYPNAGIFGSSTLLDWLNTYTFPLESSLSSLSRAHTVYSRCVNRTLSNGTTSAAYFATIHVGATNLLADICLAAGQRAFIGRVCMNSDLSPDFYRDESVEAAMRDTEATIEHIDAIDPGYALITPIITPRFAPSCTSALLTALGTLHSETNLPIQTHVSENTAEVALVKDLFPESESYTHVYDTHGLLTPSTILAHAVHLSPTEQRLVKQRGAKISHCPASNSALTSGRAPIRSLLDQGITVGLGTDVSGGWSASVLEVGRQACLVSRHLAMEVDGEERDRTKLSVEEMLYLATRGGAAVCGLENRVGGFEVGMEWDAQMVGLALVNTGEEEEGVDGSGDLKGAADKGMDVDRGRVDIFGWESWSDRVAKWVWGGDDRNTLRVWVRGRLVHWRT